MKLNTNEKGDIILEDIYSGIELKTKDGESIKICMRDSGFEFNYMGIDYEAQKGVIRKRKNDGTIYVSTLKMADTLDSNGNIYSKECLKKAVEQFNKKKQIGELDHLCPENEDKLNYFLCSNEVVELFPQYAHSKPIESGYGYEFDKQVKYYVAKLDFDYISECYNNIIEPFENTEADLSFDFWCEECVEGTMNVDTLTIHNMSSNGLFKQFENKLGLTTDKNRAMIIKNLAKKYNITPIEFIDKIYYTRMDYKKYNRLYPEPVKTKCCNNCSHFNYEPPQMYQPYPEFWCSKKHWEGICSKEEENELHNETNCSDYEERK